MVFMWGKGERGRGRLGGQLARLRWGEEKGKKKRGGAGPVEKMPQEAWGKRKPFSISKPFINCKLF
jgi:hypothetical protein